MACLQKILYAWNFALYWVDVHDVGSWYKPIEAGMVFTVEPGIYIREENLGIRLENDILITENGYRDLMAHIPLEADDVEAAMKA